MSTTSGIPGRCAIPAPSRIDARVLRTDTLTTITLTTITLTTMETSL
ncbi:MAG: hypothetical protein ACR2JG_09170 [Geodermatophilaceae bacterium]